MKNKKLLLGIGTGILAVGMLIGGMFFLRPVYGNQTFIPSYSNCSYAYEATTTRAWIIPGTATTTLSCDTYNMAPNLPQGTIVDSMDLLVQLTSSTTALSRIINVSYEMSMDNIDWYPVLISSSTIVLGQTGIHLASTTENYIWAPGDTTASTTLAVIPVPNVITRYIRAKFSIPIGSSNGAVWSEFIPKKQVSE